MSPGRYASGPITTMAAAPVTTLAAAPVTYAAAPVIEEIIVPSAPATQRVVSERVLTSTQATEMAAAPVTTMPAAPVTTMSPRTMSPRRYPSSPSTTMAAAPVTPASPASQRNLLAMGNVVSERVVSIDELRRQPK